MTCKDCVYCDKCYSRIVHLMDIDEITGEIQDIEKRCTSFKNKHNFVEVVRCKDCLYRHTVNCNAKHERADMDYCSHGVRKEQEENDA